MQLQNPSKEAPEIQGNAAAELPREASGITEAYKDRGKNRRDNIP